MRIAHDTNKMSHGVTTLAYVGDADAATDAAVITADHMVGAVALGIGACAAYYGSGLTRILGIAAAAYAVSKMRR